jgi:hypothetical protein
VAGTTHLEENCVLEFPAKRTVPDHNRQRGVFDEGVKKLHLGRNQRRATPIMESTLIRDLGQGNRP